MRPAHAALFVTITASFVLAVMSISSEGASPEDASPIFGVTMPDGYRQWELIAPSQEAEPLNELRAVLGNTAAIDAYKRGTLPFPDGTILAKLARNMFRPPNLKQLPFPARPPLSRSW